jgi:hypothetical protein
MTEATPEQIVMFFMQQTTISVLRCANPYNFKNCEGSFSVNINSQGKLPEFQRMICTTCFKQIEADIIRGEQYYEALLNNEEQP